jgi:hypothetical protein
MTAGGSTPRANGRTHCLDARAVASLIILRFGLAGCHRQPQHYPTRDIVDAGVGAASITVRSDDCPAVVFTVSPEQARIGQAVSVSARATDPDPGDSMAFSWTASAGSFANAAAAATTYTCPGRDHAGPQTITLAVSDGSCTTTRQAPVICVALADGGSPPATGGGGGADAGANCAQGDPTTCEGDPCNRCTNDHCDTLASQSAKGGVPIAGCDIFVSDDQQARCQKLYACMRDSNCVQNSDPTRCWCGSVDPYQCETGMEPAGGPCVQQFMDAASSSDAVVINDRLTDSRFPIGGAINLAACRSVYCSRLSDPPNPVCVF